MKFASVITHQHVAVVTLPLRPCKSHDPHVTCLPNTHTCSVLPLISSAIYFLLSVDLIVILVLMFLCVVCCFAFHSLSQYVLLLMQLIKQKSALLSPPIFVKQFGMVCLLNVVAIYFSGPWYLTPVNRFCLLFFLGKIKLDSDGF